MRLTRDAILEVKDRETVEVECPEWGGSVLVRGMTGRERDAWEMSLVDEASRTTAVQRGSRGQRAAVSQVSSVNIRARLVVRCVVDEDGDRLFTDADVAALGEKSGAAIDRVATVALRLCGMGADDMEELAGNFGGTDPGGGSSSPSPATSGRPPESSSPG